MVPGNRYAMAHPQLPIEIAKKHIEGIRAGKFNGVQLSGNIITSPMWAIVDAALAVQLPIFSTLSENAHQQLQDTMPGVVFHRRTSTG